MLPYHTTNSYMVGLLGVQNGSERLEFAFSALPPDRPAAVVVADGKEENIFLAYVVAYFGWPRQVHSIAVTHVNAEAQLQAFDRNSVSAIFFCGIDPPPSMQPVIKIAPSIVMIPTLLNPEPTAP